MFDLHFLFSEILIIFILFGYICGSVPFGLVLTKLHGIDDIRNIGSGNIGATNVLRTGKKSLALMTLILDTLKSYLAIKISLLVITEFDFFNTLYQNQLFVISIVGVFSVLGHCFPIWLKFKGGKGVATGIGVMIAFNPSIGFLGILIWILVFFITKISSFSALVTFFIYPFLLYIFNPNKFMFVSFSIISLIIFCKHHENILRLIKNEEPKFKK